MLHLRSSCLSNVTASSKTGLLRATGSAAVRGFSGSTVQRDAMVLGYSQHGSPGEVLSLQKAAAGEPKANEVLVKMLFAPVNPADLNMVEGSYGILPSLPAVGGNEGVGVVEKVGSGVNLAAGDHVILNQPGLGTWRTRGVFPAGALLKVPADVKPEYAAAAAVNPTTAYRLLADFEQLQAGDVVIQNGANSMVGSCVIQMARQRGVQTVNVVRQRPEAEFSELSDRLKAAGATVVVDDQFARTPAFRKLLADMPPPRLALNCVGGRSATELARCLAPGGSLVTYGGMARQPVTVPTSLLIFRDLRVRGFWMTQWKQQNSAEPMLNEIFDMMRAGDLKLWLERHQFSQFAEGIARTGQSPSRKVIFSMD